MYELLRIKSACEATLAADDYEFFTQLACINRAISQYETIRPVVSKFIYYSTPFGDKRTIDPYISSLDYSEEWLYKLLAEKLRRKRAAVKFTEYREIVSEKITQRLADVTTLLNYLTDVSNIKRYFRAEHAEHVVIDNVLYLYTPRNADYYYLQYDLNATISPSKPPTSSTISPDYKYINALYCHLFPERCL